MTTEDKTQEELTAEEQEFADWFKDSIFEMFGELFEIKDKEHYDEDALNEDEGAAINRLANRFHRKLISDRRAQAKKLTQQFEDILKDRDRITKAKLLDAIEERGPENITGFESDRYEIGVEDGFDRSNKEWRSLLKELRKEL
jgi:hypothetical protein